MHRWEGGSYRMDGSGRGFEQSLALQKGNDYCLLTSYFPN